MTMFAFTRSRPIKTVQGLVAASRHGARADKSAARRMRPGADPERRAFCLRGPGVDDEGKRTPSKAGYIGTPTPGDPLPPACDYLQAFKDRKTLAGARERKGSALALHVLLGVSSQWLEETGGLHDPANRRIQQLIQVGNSWARETFGKDSVIGLRYDLDERGGAVLDILVTPVSDLKFGRSKVAKPTVSVRQALDALAARHGVSRAMSFSAVNTSWAEYAARKLDKRLKRGQPKKETAREHIAPDAFKAGMATLELKRQSMQLELEAARAEGERVRRETAARAAQAQADLAQAQAEAEGLRGWIDRWKSRLARAGIRFGTADTPPLEPPAPPASGDPLDELMAGERPPAPRPAPRRQAEDGDSPAPGM